MLNPQGYSIITEPGERAKEQDTFTCAHCGFITFTKAGLGPLQVAVVQSDGSVFMKDAGFCRRCYRHVCPKCENDLRCVPIEKRIEDLERKTTGGIILP